MIPRKSVRLGGLIGTIIGTSGWLIGLVAVSVGTGDLRAISTIWFPGLLLSLGSGIMAILILECVPSRMRTLALWGAVAFYMGFMGFLSNVWIAPQIDAAASPGFRQFLRMMGGNYNAGNTQPLIFLTIGVALLTFTLRSVYRGANSKTAE